MVPDANLVPLDGEQLWDRLVQDHGDAESHDFRIEDGLADHLAKNLEPVDDALHRKIGWDLVEPNGAGGTISGFGQFAIETGNGQKEEEGR